MEKTENDMYEVAFNEDKTELIEYPRERNNESYTISDGTTSIGIWAFVDCY